jgi:hypothetical protein
MKLASRLSALYAALLGVTVVIVILASSIALVFELWGFSRDITEFSSINTNAKA